MIRLLSIIVASLVAACRAGRPIVIAKNTTSAQSRFLFVAGLGGTGHHGWFSSLGGSPGGPCPRANGHTDTMLRSMWYSDKQSDDAERRLVAALRAEAAADATPSLHCLNGAGGKSMLSYPDNQSQRYHPNLVSLARAAEAAEVDLRIVVMHRAPASMISSLSRRFLKPYVEAHTMTTQAALLNAQLLLIDPKFFLCVGYTETAERVPDIYAHVVQGMRPMHPRLDDALKKGFHPEADDEDAALRALRAAGGGGDQIMGKLDELGRLSGFLLSEVCPKVS